MVSIVGAGPGAADLLTVRALQRLQQAEVVLYDNLVSADVLACCPAGALMEYAGKKYGDKVDPMTRQNRINQLMVEYARAGKKVVRLKSGDPFIYGRAIEEIRYLRECGIDCEVVPGITAGIAAAAAYHIPLTERNVSNAVLFCTGHTAGYDLQQLDALARMLHNGMTLVLYMGLSNLQPLLEKLQSIAGDEKIYLSAISQVSMPTQQIVTDDLDHIGAAIEQARLPMPVVFIIGRQALSLQQAESLLHTASKPSIS
jgi:uroporphyrin-III C-methyltransferase